MNFSILMALYINSINLSIYISTILQTRVGTQQKGRKKGRERREKEKRSSAFRPTDQHQTKFNARISIFSIYQIYQNFESTAYLPQR